MQLALKRAIIKYIQESDLNNDVVVSMTMTSDGTAGEIKYNWDHIGKTRECGKWSDDVAGGAEELVRAFLLVRLVKELSYPLDRSLILEEAYSIGHPTQKNARLDVRIEDKRDAKKLSSFLLIECKAPEVYESERTNAIRNQLFAIAAQEHTANNRPVSYLAYYTVRLADTHIREEVEIVDYSQYQNWEQWDAANQPVASKTIPARYGVAIKNVYVNKSSEALKPGEETLDSTKDRDFFQRLQRDLHNKLWGGSTEYNYIFKNLSRLFLAKIFDELTTKAGKPYRFQVQQQVDPKTKHAINESPQQLFDRMKELVKDSTTLLGYSASEKEKYGIEEDYIDANKVSYVVTQLQWISVIENIHVKTGDILGDFFEGIISEGFKQDKGTFFTHKNIVYFLLYGLGVDTLVNNLATDSVDPRLPYICDPACGSGTFLIEAMRFVTHFLPEKKDQTPRVKQALSEWKTDEAPHAWAGRYIYGIDNNPDLALATKVNMVLHRDGNLHIFRGNALKPFEKFPENPCIKKFAKRSAQAQT